MPVYQLGISQLDYKTIIDDLSTNHPNATNLFFSLENETVGTSASFLKYALKIKFDNTNGVQEMTTAAISVYSIDGYYFFTRDYSTNFNYFKEFVNVTAEFLPRDNFNGEFGFDWLRKGDVDGQLIDKPFNKIISDHYKLSNPTDLEPDGNEWKGVYKFNTRKYIRLKNKEYKSTPVVWKLTAESNEYERDLGVSFINFYRKNITTNPRAKLRLLLRAIKKPLKLIIKYPKDLFAIRLVDNVTTPDTNPLDATGKFRILAIPVAQLPLNNSKKFINLEIENISDINEDVEISIQDEANEICGKVIVKKNNEVISKKVLVIQLRDNLPISNSTLGEQDATVNLVADISKFLSHANIEPIYETPYIVINTAGNIAFQALKVGRYFSL